MFAHTHTFVHHLSGISFDIRSFTPTWWTLANSEQTWSNAFVHICCNIHTWWMHTFARVWPNTFAKCICDLIHCKSTRCFGRQSRYNNQNVAEWFHINKEIVHKTITENLKKKVVCAICSPYADIRTMGQSRNFLSQLPSNAQKWSGISFKKKKNLKTRILREECYYLFRKKNSKLLTKTMQKLSQAMKHGVSLTTQKANVRVRLGSTLSQPRQGKFRFEKSHIKTMLVVALFDSRGLIRKEFIPTGQTINANFYKDVVNRLIKRINCIRPALRAFRDWFLQHDNAASVRQFLAKKKL